MLGVKRLERAVLRLEADSTVLLAMERLDGGLVRGLVLSDERDDDIALARVILPADDDDVPVENAGLDHRLALDTKQEVGVSAEHLGDGDPLLDVFLGEQRSACGDAADEG